MKNLKTINALFEQANNETNFKLLGPPTTKPVGSGSVRIQWQYKFSWPAKNPILGDVKELINTINNSTDSDAKQVLSAIQGSDTTHEVGILRAEASTQNNRLFAKDLGEFTGWIYLFYPGTINKDAVPDNQKVTPGVDGRMTYLLDAKGEFKKYFQAPSKGQSSPASDKKADQSSAASAEFKLASFALKDGPAYEWFNSPEGLRLQYLNPVYAKIGDTKVPITTTNDIVSIFWEFVSRLPEGLAIAKPGVAAAANTYSPELKSAILNLFKAAAKYDDSNFGLIDADVLAAELYNQMFYAVVILGLNAGKIDINSLDFTKNLTSAPYYAPFKAALTAAGAIVKPVASTGASAGSATFDGTNITTEDQVLKIFAGVVVSDKTLWGTPDVSTIDKVKTYFKTNMNKTSAGSYENMFAAIKKFSGFKHGQTYSGSKGFKDFESVVKGTNTGKFDDSLLTIIKSAVAASPIK